MSLGIELAERGLLPDPVVSWGIRRLLRDRLSQLKRAGALSWRESYDAVLRALRETPAPAIKTREANEQHYEVPTEFFLNALGKRLKYSCCWYPEGSDARDLDAAEERMLALTCERARLEDGQEILELGCGWGSLTLWMAEKYPNARVLGVSNSATQREFILSRCRERGFANVEIMTRDINALELEPGRFDRVVSVEMFEHVRGYDRLFAKVAGWMKPSALLFVHVFVHGSSPYLFEDEGEDDWMARHFFSGGVMPSEDLFHHFQRDVSIIDQWRVEGAHYEKTARAWLANMDARRDAIMPALAARYGAADAARWFQRWRIFFLSCAELWGYDQGREWWVSHYLFEPKRRA
jgi:cyclopropane-fatty-acyl-phospholipid synthase